MIGRRPKVSEVCLRAYLAILLIFLLAACGSVTEPVEQFAEGANTRLLQGKNYLRIGGKVVDPLTGKWPNDILVVVFLMRNGDIEGSEVGRALTQLGEFVMSSEGVQDGLFSVDLPNSYELPWDAELTLNQSKNLRIVAHTDMQQPITQLRDELLHMPSTIHDAYIWLGEVEIGSINKLEIPGKNISYAIKVFPGPYQSLPIELLQEGSTVLTKDNKIIVSEISEKASISEYSRKTILKSVRKNSQTEIIEVNRFTIPIDNCAGSARFEQSFTQSQTYIHEYKAEVGASINFPVSAATLGLEGTYGFSQGETKTETVSYLMSAEPKTSQTYIISWQEVWESGVAVMQVGESAFDIPFNVKTNLIYSVSSEPGKCS